MSVLGAVPGFVTFVSICPWSFILRAPAFVTASSMAMGVIDAISR